MEDAGLEWTGAPGELQAFGPRFTARAQLLDQIFRASRPARALDIGCGRGAITRILARRAGQVVATEVSEAAVHAARQSLADLNNVTVSLMDLFANDRQFPQAEQRFNLILLSEVLEHLEDDVGALRRVRPLLEDDGVLVVTVPRDPAFWSLEDEMWGHKRRYLREDLAAKLQSGGFRSCTVWTWGFPLTKFLVMLQIRRLSRRVGEGTESFHFPPLFPRWLLHTARVVFRLIARLESLFRATDRGVGYIVMAEPVARER